jgi:heme/copper-type cytochrome/quinol oxidase subunit 2
MAVPSTRVLTQIYDSSESELDVLITGYQWRWQYKYLTEEGEEVAFFSNLTTHQPGLSNATIDFNVIYDDADPGYVKLESAKVAKSTFQGRFRPRTFSGGPQKLFSGFITSFSIGAPLDGMQTVDITMRVTGAIQDTVQP